MCAPYWWSACGGQCEPLPPVSLCSIDLVSPCFPKLSQWPGNCKVRHALLGMKYEGVTTRGICTFGAVRCRELWVARRLSQDSSPVRVDEQVVTINRAR